MSISDYSTVFRGRAYTQWKRWQLAKYLAEMLEAGHTVTYYPQKGYWGIKYNEQKHQTHDNHLQLLSPRLQE